MEVCLGELGPNAQITELSHQVKRLAVGTGRVCLSVVEPPTAEAHIPSGTGQRQCTGSGDPRTAAGAGDEHIGHDGSLMSPETSPPLDSQPVESCKLSVWANRTQRISSRSAGSPTAPASRLATFATTTRWGSWNRHSLTQSRAIAITPSPSARPLRS